ncbi:MAG: DUF4118 domain-containing protein, partial [Gemmataceae bacterium]
MSIRQNLLFRYGLAIGSVALATWMRWLLEPVLGEHFPFGFAYIAVLLTAWLGGWGPSLVAFVLALVSSNFLFIPPRQTFSIFAGEHLVGFIIFTMVGVVSILVSESLHRARKRAEQSMQEARDKARALEAEIEKRTELEEQLRQHAHELAEAHRRKDEFLGMLAHELRNPLAPVRNGLEVLKQLGLEDTPLERVRVIMERQVKHLIHLINDLLDVSRITQGRIQLQKDRLDVREAVQHALETCQPVMDARRHRLDVSLPQHRV